MESLCCQVDLPQTEQSRYFLSLLVMPRSLLILQENMYQHFLHGIQPSTQDVLTDRVANLPVAGPLPGATLPRGTRVSLTVRHVPKGIKPSLLLGRQ